MKAGRKDLAQEYYKKVAGKKLTEEDVPDDMISAVKKAGGSGTIVKIESGGKGGPGWYIYTKSNALTPSDLKDIVKHKDLKFIGSGRSGLIFVFKD